MFGFGLRLIGLLVSLPLVAVLLFCDMIRVLAGTILLGTRAEGEENFRAWTNRWVKYVMNN